MDQSKFAEYAALIAVGLVAAVIGVFKYVKTQITSPETKPSDPAAVLTASFIDSRLLKELIDTLREHMEEYARENKKVTRSNQDVREAIQENTEALVVQTDATLNMLRFIKNRDAVQRDA